jgi:hypothetical protein
MKKEKVLRLNEDFEEIVRTIEREQRRIELEEADNLVREYWKECEECAKEAGLKVTKHEE